MHTFLQYTACSGNESSFHRCLMTHDRFPLLRYRCTVITLNEYEYVLHVSSSTTALQLWHRIAHNFNDVSLIKGPKFLKESDPIILPIRELYQTPITLRPVTTSTHFTSTHYLYSCCSYTHNNASVTRLHKITYHVSSGLHWWGLARITEENNFRRHLRLLSVFKFMTAQTRHGKVEK